MASGGATQNLDIYYKKRTSASLMIKVAIVGFGNVGKYALDAIQEASDMELVGIVSKHLSENKPVEFSNINVVDDVDKLGKVDVAILATATRKVEETALK